MKRIGQKMLLLVMAVLLSCGLTGCMTDSTVEDLFTLPQPPMEYAGLARTINQLIAEGYEYASPTGGQNIQSVQMVDLNMDGRSEAIAFFRRAGDEKPLKIMVFFSQGESYELLCTIESSGSHVESVQYQDMNSDGTQELIVGWKISTDVQNVAVYSVGTEPAVLLHNAYTRYSIQELDGDGVPSLLLFRAGAEGNSVAEFYGWRTDAMTLVYRTPLSSTMAELGAGSIVNGKMNENTPAVYVTGVNEKGMAVTDILMCGENGTLANAALNWSTGVSGVIYPYRQLIPQDINGDGITEIPAPAVTSEQGKKNDGVVYWLQCDSNGNTWRAVATYHCQSNGWYFALPDEWLGRVTTVATESALNENQVVLKVDDVPVAALYTISGENRENRASRGNRMVLKRQTGTVYAGELFESSAALGFTEEQLRSGFHLIVSSWTA